MKKKSVILISGGAGRLGASFARELVAKGNKVIIFDLNEEAGNDMVSSLGSKNSFFYLGDITSKRDMRLCLDYSLKRYGQIDAAVNCAYPMSIQWGKQFEDINSKELKEDLFNHLGGAILFSQTILKQFLNQGFGHLINISSIQGVTTPKFEHYKGTEMTSPIEYSAIKSGIISITRYLAKYYKDKGIRVNCISPGGIIDNQPESFLLHYKQSCNSKGMLDSKDISGALIFLLSDSSKFVNGQNIIVDDGWSL